MNGLSQDMTLVLDAMGVIYETGDDVTDLLVPFIAEKGGTTDVADIEHAYHDASLGLMTSLELLSTF